MASNKASVSEDGVYTFTVYVAKDMPAHEVTEEVFNKLEQEKAFLLIFCTGTVEEMDDYSVLKGQWVGERVAQPLYIGNYPYNKHSSLIKQAAEVEFESPGAKPVIKPWEGVCSG